MITPIGEGKLKCSLDIIGSCLEVFMKRWIIFLLVFPLVACSQVSPDQGPESTISQSANQEGNMEKESPPPAIPTDTPQPLNRSDLPDLGKAPELTNEVWLNTDAPLRLAELGGKVVLLDMWTFG
jgi:hypothetical protein